MNSSSRVQRNSTGFFGSAGESGRFDGRFARVLAAEATAEIGHDDTDVFLWHAECALNSLR